MEHQGEYLREGATSPGMSMDEHMRMMERRRIATLWCHFANVVLGLWVLTGPFLFGYLAIAPEDLDLQRLAGERSLPDVETRALLMTWSDVISGTLIVLFSALSLARVSWAQWANAAIGLWLMFAPLVFWSPSPASYASGTLVGGLVITFSVLVPMMPGMSMQGMMQKASIPPGWDYNPSTWLQRIPIAILAVLGVILARYLAAYQLGHTESAWDPFFGAEPNGTETIITSDMSKAWPVSDAGIGVVAYMLEFLMAVMGDARRWRTMPWTLAAIAPLVPGVGEHLYRRMQEQRGDSNTDRHIRPQRAGEGHQRRCGQHAGIGDEIVARAQPARAHVEVVAAMPVDQHEADSVGGERNQPHDSHPMRVRYDA